MGLLKKKKTIKIERLGNTDAIIKTDGTFNSSEVCDLLISALCLSLKTASKGDETMLGLYKMAAINQIKQIQ